MQLLEVDDLLTYISMLTIIATVQMNIPQTSVIITVLEPRIDRFLERCALYLQQPNLFCNSYVMLCFVTKLSLLMSLWFCLTVFQGRTIYFTSCRSEGWSSRSSSSTDSQPALWLWFPVCCEWCTRMYNILKHFDFDGNCFVVEMPASLTRPLRWETRRKSNTRNRLHRPF